MSRTMSATNIAEAEAGSLEVVIMVAFNFQIPVYVHSNIGTLTYAGNDYLGVGDLGAIGGLEETEALQPSPITLELSGVVSTHIAEALNAGNYGESIEIYLGYLSEGALVDDPVPLAAGTFEHAEIELGERTNKVVITMQHDLARLELKNGRRWTDEDQQVDFPGDEFFSMMHRVGQRRLTWGGGPPLNRGGSINRRPGDD